MASQSPGIADGLKAHRKGEYGDSMDIEIEDDWETESWSYAKGREFLGLTPAHFAPGPGRRFWTLEEWKADQTAKIEAMHKQMRDRCVVPESDKVDIKF